MGENDQGVEASYHLCWTVLEGDVNGDGNVNSLDEGVLVNENSNTTTTNNYRCDVDLNGLIEGNSQIPEGADYVICNGNTGNSASLCGGNP